MRKKKEKKIINFYKKILKIFLVEKKKICQFL